MRMSVFTALMISTTFMAAVFTFPGTYYRDIFIDALGYGCVLVSILYSLLWIVKQYLKCFRNVFRQRKAQDGDNRINRG